MCVCACVYGVTAYVRGEPIVYDFFTVKKENFHISIICIGFSMGRALRAASQSPTTMSAKGLVNHDTRSWNANLSAACSRWTDAIPWRVPFFSRTVVRLSILGDATKRRHIYTGRGVWSVRFRQGRYRSVWPNRGTCPKEREIARSAAIT